MRRSPLATLVATLWISVACGQDPANPKVVELPDAVRLALERNPQLRAAQMGVQASAGRRLQAGAIPNPTLSAEVENFSGSGESKGFDESETTVALEQTLELGGKRAARRNAAGAEVKRAEWERDALRLEVIRQTTERFVDTMAAQVELALSQEARQTAETIHQAAANRVKAGKDSPVEEARARAELALSNLAVERARGQLKVCRQALSAMWAEAAPDFTAVQGNIAEVAPELPPMARLQEAMTRSPEWARWADDIRAAERAVEAERRSWIPDLSIGAGIRQSQADNSQAYVAGVSMELPVFDRRRGNVLAAEAELERTRADQEAAHAALRNELAATHERLTSLKRAAVSMAQDALPAAEQAFAAAQASYAGGKTGYLDLQDARRSLLDMRRLQIETMADHHRAVAQVERLAGTPLKTLK